MHMGNMPRVHIIIHNESCTMRRNGIVKRKAEVYSNMIS